MKRFVSGSLALAICLLPGLTRAGQRDFADVEIKATPVSGVVYMLTGEGGNIGASVGPDGVLIIDDQFAPLAEKIKTALRGIGGGELEYVLNTHYHGDHTGGNPIFGAEAPIIAQTNVRRRLATEQNVRGRVVPPMAKVGLPVITFDDSLSVHFNGEEIKLMHAPNGHTDGDSIVFFTESNVVHMGDQFFNGAFPFVDLGGGGTVDGYIRNVANVISRTPADAKIIPGHGPLATLEDLRAFHAMLVETTGIVRDKIRAGKTLAQIKAEGLPEKWRSWGEGFIDTDAWIETIYNSSTGAKGASADHGHRH